MAPPKTIGSREVHAAIERLAAAIGARHRRTKGVLVLGIANGGIPLARRLCARLGEAGIQGLALKDGHPPEKAWARSAPPGLAGGTTREHPVSLPVMPRPLWLLAQPQALAPLVDWMTLYGAFWRERFDRLEALLERME